MEIQPVQSETGSGGGRVPAWRRRMGHGRDGLKFFAGLLLLGAVYFAAGRVGLIFAEVNGNVTPIWPPTGIAVAAVLLFGYRVWPGLALGALLVTASTGAPLSFAAIVMIGNPLQALGAAYLLQRFARFDSSFGRTHDVLQFAFLGVAISPVISATIGGIGICLTGLADWSMLPRLWFLWWLGDAMGVLLVAPFLLTLRRWLDTALRVKHAVEGLALTGCIVLVSTAIYGNLFGIEITGPLSYLAFPFVIWAGFRFLQCGVATATFVVAAVAVWITADGQGPFGLDTVGASLVSLHGYLGVLALVGMLLAATLAERRRALGTAESAQNSLEQAVEARTAELRAANSQLSAEIDRHSRTGQALRKSEERYRTLYNETPVMLHSIDRETRISSVNSHWLNVLGYQREEVIGQRLTDFLTDRSHQYAAKVALPKFFQTGEVTDVPYQFVTKSGSVVDILLSAYAERDAQGQVIGSRSVLIDVTEQKRSKAALQESEERLRQAVQLSGLGYYLWDAIQDRCIYCSEECGRIHGTTVDGYISRSSPLDGAFSFVFAEDRERVRAEFKALRAGRAIELEYRLITPAGEVRYVREIAKPIFDQDGKVVREHGTIQDITEAKLAEAAIREKDENLRELQSQLMQTSRVSAMAQMSLGIAHELNQPLGAMVNYIGAAKRIISAEGHVPPRADELIRKASEQAIQAGDIIRGLRRLFEKGGMVASAQDINEALKEVISLSAVGARKEKVVAVLELSDDLPPALIDKVQIQQVMFNLLRNSLEAMRTASKRVMTVSSHQKDDLIEVSISDTGPGLPPEVQNRLFDPFVTTKPDGMGVGLSICHEIIQAHGGTLRATPNPEGGTVFTFTVPTASAREVQHGDVA